MRTHSPLLFGLALVTAACAGSRPVPAADPKFPCGPEIPGAGEVLVPGGTVLLGEMHGTNEIPKVIAELACEAASRGLPVTLALELAESEQIRLDSFMAGRGSAADRALLLTGTMWHRERQDGRTSAAMLELLDRVRALRGLGAKVRALAYESVEGEPDAREQAMAALLVAERQAHPADLLLIVSGNLRAHTMRGVEWDPSLVPMGVYLRERVPNLMALAADWLPGTAYTCKPTEELQCGVLHIASLVHFTRRQPPTGRWARGETFSQSFDYSDFFTDDADLPTSLPPRPRPPAAQPTIRMIPRTADGFDGTFFVGPLTASAPALETSRAGR